MTLESLLATGKTNLFWQFTWLIWKLMVL